MFENARWISNYKKQNSTPENVGACGFNEKNIHGSFIFRKEIEIAGTVDSAIISVCGLGYGVFTINGNKVTEDVLTTPFTRYDKTVIYQQYDVTNLLTKGINTIGAYIGNGWYNDVAAVWDYDKADWRDSPKMLLQLDVTYTDGTKTTYVSDSSWKFHAGPSLYNHIREGEIYDARLEISEWNLNGFDDSEWEFVSICRPPGGILKTSKLPPERIIRTLQATHLGNGIYDFGENTSGWVHIKAKGKTGTEISIKYAEVYKDGDIDTTQIDRYMKNDLRNCDIYIMKGEDWEEYEPTFCYHGFRYVKVTNAPKDFEIYACVVHTDLEKIGDFECSDPMLNKIHQASVRATITNYHGFPVDCPHREQNGWTGDALVSADQTLMNFDVTDAYKKWLWDFKDVQRPSGQLPGVIPCAGWGYNRHGGPSYGSAVIYLPYLLYKNTGDFSLVSDMWENMKLYMEHLNHMADDYIIDFGYGDWLPPKGANICPRIVTDTSYYYTDAVIMAEIADIIGEDSKSYTELASNIKSSFRAKFIDVESELLKSQTFISCCIYQDLLYDNEKHLWAKKLADLVINNGYHIDCGILGTKFIFTSLTEYGYEDVLYKMITNPTCPSYAHWILSGMTTFCETWEMNDSLNHHMFSEVDMWFYKYLAGIKIDKDDITIKPVFLEGLDWVKAHHRDIKVCFTRNEMTVSVPGDATVIIGDREYSVSAGEHRFELKDRL